MAARIQAKVLFEHAQLPKTDRLWAEAMHWACEALNHTACSANPDSKSPYETWYGEARPARPYPFLKPAYCKWQRPSKLLPKEEEGEESDDDVEAEGGQETGEVESEDPGEHDEVESEDPGGHEEESMDQGGQDTESAGPGGQEVEVEASPPAARRPQHVVDLADFNTAARDAVELPKELIQDVEPEPGSYQEALRSKHATIWDKAMSAEVEGLIRAGTFTLAAKIPEGCNVIDARWVFKWKADETGKIVKAKARLVAKGFKQKHGVDYLETFSPTANAASIRLVVALACKYNLELLHLDIEQAFVQSKLDHEVFMKLPPGCDSMSGKIVRLNKSLYGLKQAPRTFYKRLVYDLLRIGFEQSLSDPCVLRFMMEDEVMGIIAIHVDDILYAETKGLAEVIVEALGDSLPTKNLGEVIFFLGCAFSRDREAGTIEISQESCIRSVLERFNICRTSSIPASPANDSRSVMEDEEAGDVPFREVVGCLMWIANNTRPETSNALRTVARHSHEPKKSDWKAAQKILSYLKETAHLTLKYKQDTTVDVGTLVYVALTLPARPLTKCVSLSTSEAEYIAMGDGVKEALFVNGMLQFLRPSAKPRKIDVFEDNEGAIALAENPLSSSRSKHIDVRHHFLRNLTEEGVIEVTHVPSKEQHADILTKALPRNLFEVHGDFVLGSVAEK
ncbi:unnamed protein product [Ectocarpus sp. CCAP 1310/34]|nr:unnamed protein product [Ectocarpus sp. CCAP 1310/34]